MSNPDDASGTGHAFWHDLTVPDAKRSRDFYAKVVGWSPEPVNMGGYADFNMVTGGEPKAGVCFRRGSNQDVPTGWIVYFAVDDLDQAVSDLEAGGGSIIGGVRSAGGQRYCIATDPDGNAFGLGEV
ncbi:MAG: VOC family protein [Planctomycetota bacterium]